MDYWNYINKKKRFFPVLIKTAAYSYIVEYTPKECFGSIPKKSSLSHVYPHALTAYIKLLTFIIKRFM